MIWVGCAAYMKGNENCIRNSGQKTLETNKGVGKGTKLKCILEQCFSNIFSNVPLSQYKTCTCNTVTVQNMFMVHYHNTKYVCVPLGTATINGYIQDMVLPGCFRGRLKHQRCGNIKFCSRYFCNSM